MKNEFFVDIMSIVSKYRVTCTVYRICELAGAVHLSSVLCRVYEYLRKRNEIPNRDLRRKENFFARNEPTRVCEGKEYLHYIRTGSYTLAFKLKGKIIRKSEAKTLLNAAERAYGRIFS